MNNALNLFWTTWRHKELHLKPNFKNIFPQRLEIQEFDPGKQT